MCWTPINQRYYEVLKLIEKVKKKIHEMEENFEDDPHRLGFLQGQLKQLKAEFDWLRYHTSDC